MQKSIGKTMIQKTTRKFLFKLEDSIASFVLFLLALIPFLEILFRVVFKKDLLPVMNIQPILFCG